MIAKIVKITDLEGKPKTDGRYPLRVDAIVDAYPAIVGQRLNMNYIADGEGNLKFGVLSTSTVQDVENEADGTIKVTTRNSVYVLKELAGSHV